MVIGESVLINAPVKKVWETFTDLTCWKEWNTVCGDVRAKTKRITKGESLKFCIRPFDIPIHIEPVVEEIIPEQRIVWAGKKHGVSASHEFTFEKKGERTMLRSRETFSGKIITSMKYLFPKRKIQQLSAMMLLEIKLASEMKLAKSRAKAKSRKKSP